MKVEYEIGERTTLLSVVLNEDAMAYVENNPVGTIIDIRQNPVDGEYPHFFVVEGGCPSQPLSNGEIVGGFVCFGLIITILGIDQIRNKIRNN